MVQSEVGEEEKKGVKSGHFLLTTPHFFLKSFNDKPSIFNSNHAFIIPAFVSTGQSVAIKNSNVHGILCIFKCREMVGLKNSMIVKFRLSL